jgi:long-subunit fatty acid transport protein
MRRILFLLVAALFAALPAAAQNTDIESLSGLQFNFGNPGARSLGMGGAFLGRADDASAAEANPAGLTILRKAELSIEARNYMEAQVLTTSGTFPDLERTGFAHYSDRVQVTFASGVLPIKDKFTLAAYYHNPLRNKGAGLVIPQRNEFSGALEKDVPTFHLPRGGPAPVDAEECARIRQQSGDFLACVEWAINPFISSIDVEQRTWGIGGAWQIHPKFSVGATVRYQTFMEEALTFRVAGDLSTAEITTQATGQLNDDGELILKNESDMTFSGGFKWTPHEKFSVGGVYKQGASFKAPTFFASSDTNFEFIDAFPTTFHIPDVMGIGVSVQPTQVLTINLDAVHITYSNLVDDFFSFSSIIRENVENPYKANDATEIRLGAEYFFTGKLPFALRAGVWHDPAHSVEWNGPMSERDYVAEAVLFPEGEDQMHWSIGAGLAWPRFQIDLAYDSSKYFKVGSLSMVTRF